MCRMLPKAVAPYGVGVEKGNSDPVHQRVSSKTQTPYGVIAIFTG